MLHHDKDDVGDRPSSTFIHDLQKMEDIIVGPRQNNQYIRLY